MASRAARICPLLPALASLLTAACDPAPDLVDEGVDDLEFRNTGWTCPTCNTNSPKINDASIQQVRLSGLPNADGVRMLGVRQKYGVLHTVVVTDNQDLGAVLDGVEVASGAGLVGWELVFEKDAKQFTGEIRSYDGDIESFADVGKPISAYAIAFTPAKAGMLPQNVCPTFLRQPSNEVLTVIPGETYDTELKVVDEVDPDWITFACADEAAYKVKRLGYGPIGALGPGFPAFGIPERNATLKMVSADYCGTGVSFTKHGTPLVWKDLAKTVSPPKGVVNVTESWWTAEGAVCIQMPRFADLLDVLAECNLPNCELIDLNDPALVWSTGSPI